MSVQIQMEITGLLDVEKLLGNVLPAKTKKQVVQKALIKAAKPMVDVAASKYRGLGGSGSLATSMKAYRVKQGANKRAFASIEVGPKRGDKKSLAAYFRFYGKTPTPRRLQLGIRHGHLIEFGYSSAGGQVASRRVLQSTAQSQFGAVVRGFQDNIGFEFDSAAKRNAAKQKKGKR